MSTHDRVDNGKDLNQAYHESIDKLRIEVDRINMGPKWTEEEIEIVLKHYRLNNLKKLEEVQTELANNGFNRSLQNIFSLFLKVKAVYENESLLSMKPDCSAKDLALIMSDYYSSQNGEKDRHDNLAVLGKRDPGPLVTKLESRFEKSWRPVPTKIGDRGSPKREREELGDLNSLKRLKIETKPQPKFKRSRKPKSPAGKAIVNIQFDNDLQLFQKLEILASKIGSSKRKLGQTPLGNPSMESEAYYRPYLRYVIDEYFYSDVDKGFFEYNLMKVILKRIGLNDDDKGMKVDEWNAVRRAIGKPRRFSQAFVNQELELLNTYRERARVWVTKKQLINDGIFPKELTQSIQNLTSMQVGQTVLAVHPSSFLLHRGKILTIDESNIMVNFLTNELGVCKVPDFSLMMVGERDAFGEYTLITSYTTVARSDMFDFDNDHGIQILRDVDFFAMALLIQILERKTLLVNELRHFNNLAEKRQANSLKEEFFEDMGWIGNQITALDNVLKHVTTKFRMRGFGSQNNSDKLGKNFENVFNIFKKNIEKEIEATKDSEQKEDLLEVRNFLNQTLDKKIIKEVLSEMKELFPMHMIELLEESIDSGNIEYFKKKENLKQEAIVSQEGATGETQRSSLAVEHNVGGKTFKVKPGMTLEEKVKLMHFAMDCGGILKTIASTHDINMKSNTFLRDFFSLTFDFKKECHNISNALVSLSSKIRSVH